MNFPMTTQKQENNDTETSKGLTMSNYLPRYIKNNFPNVYCATCRKPLAQGEMFYHDPYGGRGQKMFCSMVCWNTRTNKPTNEPQTPQNEPITTVNEVPKPQVKEPEQINPTIDTTNFVTKDELDEAIKENNSALTKDLRELFEELLATKETKAVEIPQAKVSDITEKIKLDGKHELTEYVKYLLRMRKYPFLFGNPGAGKSFLAESLASDMGIDFYAISCAPDMFKSELLGSVSPVNGQYIKGLFYDPFKNGGVVLLDEVCLASGSFLNVLNNAMANKTLRFPNGELIKMHKDFFLILADNSAGYGNDPMFPERQDVGQAFRDRVKYVNFDYDTKLELQIITNIMKDSKRAQKWHSTVLIMRSDMKTKHSDVPVFISPRFAYDAASDFINGRGWKEIIESGLFKGLNGDIHLVIGPTINKYMGAF